jgi:cytochrome P450
LNAEVDGLRLSDVDFVAFFVLLTIAGNETTRNQTSHTLRLSSSIRTSWRSCASIRRC